MDGLLFPQIIPEKNTSLQPPVERNTHFDYVFHNENGMKMDICVVYIFILFTSMYMFIYFDRYKQYK